ncbi:FAD-dependent monooxygenase [Streptomyces sp. NPDC088729]|uniref:FAD-dependent monooxygenase n=1 Tax=Streptomyces sp. NPDC088729 TaxID=3365876 RepID=UPI003814E793
MTRTANRRVLISGASIAGPALAYWLSRYGFEVTVVEKASAIRGGGYAIDIRGTALGVVDRMGLLPRLREKHVDTQRLTFVNPDGALIKSVSPEAIAGGDPGADIEVRRGDLADALYDVCRDRVDFRFGDSIATLEDRGDRVDVSFDGGDSRTFDLVIGADGLHSNTRGLAFGPEEPYLSYLGHVVAVFTVPNRFDLAHEGLIWNVPGKVAALYAHEPDDSAHGFLAFRQKDMPFATHPTPAAQRELVAANYPETAWHIPYLIDAMRSADDLFFDAVCQTRMPTWSRGRVALVGDAAFATSFLSGQGSSVSLVGAYILAGELARNADHTAAFASYERTARPFIEENQATAGEGGTALIPGSQAMLDARDHALNDPTALAGERSSIYTSLTLPDYTDRIADV